MDSNWEVVFIILYIQVYTQCPPCFFSHTLILKTPHVCPCVCTCKHLPLQRKQSKVIKKVSLAAPSQFLFEVACSEMRCPSLSHAHPNFPHPDHHWCCRYVCLLPCQMPGWRGCHALLGTGPQKSHNIQKTPQLCSVFSCVTVCEWVGVWV